MPKGQPNLAIGYGGIGKGRPGGAIGKPGTLGSSLATSIRKNKGWNK